MKSNLLKGAILLLVCAAAAAFGYRYYLSQIPPAPCSKPLVYSLGEFDAGFGMNSQQFLSVAAKAANVWNQSLGKVLLAYSATGTVPINLIYDYRQQTTDKLAKLGITIDDTRASYEVIKARYDTMVAAYDRQKASFDALLSDFEAAKASYEQEVSMWNSRGGAPPAQYDALQKEKDALASRATALNEAQTALNQATDIINTLAGFLNGLVHTLQLNVQAFNNVATSTGKRFDEGEFVSDAAGKRIYIYEFQDEDKLLRVLAHEMGHALGLDHVSDPKAIMYYLNEGSNEKLTAADLAELKRVCGLTL